MAELNYYAACLSLFLLLTYWDHTRALLSWVFLLESWSRIRSWGTFGLPGEKNPYDSPYRTGRVLTAGSGVNGQRNGVEGG